MAGDRSRPLAERAVTGPATPEEEKLAREIVNALFHIRQNVIGGYEEKRDPVTLIASALRSARAAGSLDTRQAAIGAWGHATLPNSTQATVLAHPQAEARDELAVDCDPEEIADVAMLAMQLAHKRGLSLDALLRAKLAKNKARKWKFDPAKGCSVHVEEPAAIRAAADGARRDKS